MTTFRRFFTRRAFLTTLLAFLVTQGAFAAEQLLTYVGTYTGKKSKGIYAFRLDLASGTLTPLGLAAEIDSPSFLAIAPNHRFLFAVNEVSTFNGKPAGAVSAFAIDAASGKLAPLNQQSSGGPGPCYLTVDKAGKNVLVANYGGGSVEVLPVKPDGSLGAATAFIRHAGASVNPQRQMEPHAHSINLDAANRFAVAADLGLDKLLVYRFDVDKGTLVPNDPAFTSVAPGAGPRHFVFHPTGRFAYVINEIVSTITAFSYDSRRGVLAELQTLPTQQNPVQGNSTAEVRVHPSGKFLYGSNRGHNSIAVYAIDTKTGKLTFVENTPTQGKIPRNFNLDPSGKFLLAANSDSDNIVVFRVDQSSGRLTPTGHTVEVGAPVCVRFVPGK